MSSATDSPSDRCILLTYTLPEGAVERGYDAWLRAEDNPFFNAIPGIARYENWRIASIDRAQPFALFDFVYIDGEDALERVWFNPDLDTFRKGWIARWGYGDGKGRVPAPVNAYGYLMRRAGAAPSMDRTELAFAGYAHEPAATHGVARWSLEQSVRKHYAIGPAPADAPWRAAIGAQVDPGFRWLTASAGAPAGGALFSGRAQLIAAPGFTPDRA